MGLHNVLLFRLLWAIQAHLEKGWQPTPVFLPGESHGQKSVAGYSLQGHTESNMTEATEHGIYAHLVSNPGLSSHLHTTLAVGGATEEWYLLQKPSCWSLLLISIETARPAHCLCGAQILAKGHWLSQHSLCSLGTRCKFHGPQESRVSKGLLIN